MEAHADDTTEKDITISSICKYDLFCRSLVHSWLFLVELWSAASCLVSPTGDCAVLKSARD